MDTRCWRVVGGADKGGILVRTGKDLASPAAPSRLSTGALVKELELEGDRLLYERATGEGPDSGWVSIRLKDKDLLVEADEDEAKAVRAGASEVSDDPRVRSRQRIARAKGVWHLVLGVAHSAPAEEVKQAYKELVLLHHPDKNPGATSEEAFKKVQQAYEDAQGHLEDAQTLARRAEGRARIKAWDESERMTFDIEILEAKEVAELLLEDECVVIDVREANEKCSRGTIPGAFEEICYMWVRTEPDVAERKLKQFHEGGRKLVVVSQSGGRCSDFACMLVDLFDFKAEDVCRLDGGFNSWDAWVQSAKSKDLYGRVCKKVIQH
mmetsp:Transcript_115047/g.245747  ORF Transcript_115047/g.245747 Transcript_115047/m.245747 type:complete len:324 (+) Transcript_115047:63-1034(+)